MTYRNTSAPWLYVAGGAALGLVALGAAATRKRRRRNLGAAQGANERSSFAGDVSDVSRPVQDALAASAHAHGVQQPLSEELVHEIFRHAVERRPTPGDQRHEVSSLVGASAIAPDEDAVGEQLVDPEAIEVPLGQSADPEIQRELWQSKLPQSDSTGGALQYSSDVRDGSYEQGVALLDEPSDEEAVTARPREGAGSFEDAYDAVSPDDLATEWLTRATEASSAPAEDRNLNTETAQLLRDAGMSVISEGSLAAASADALEAAAIADLEGTDEDEELGEGVEVSADEVEVSAVLESPRDEADSGDEEETRAYPTSNQRTPRKAP